MDRDLGGDIVRRGESRALDGLAHRDRGMGRPSRSVLDRLEPEGRHHAQRPQPLDTAAEALRLLGEELEGSRVLGPDITVRRRHEGGPQERELAPLPGRGTPGRTGAGRCRQFRGRAGHRRSRAGWR